MTKPKNDLVDQRMALIPVAEYKELLELCLRAADALDFWMNELAATEIEYERKAFADNELIAELRKRHSDNAYRQRIRFYVG